MEFGMNSREREENGGWYAPLSPGHWTPAHETHPNDSAHKPATNTRLTSSQVRVRYGDLDRFLFPMPAFREGLFKNHPIKSSKMSNPNLHVTEIQTEQKKQDKKAWMYSYAISPFLAEPCILLFSCYAISNSNLRN
jgi:hypothetical protein